MFTEWSDNQQFPMTCKEKKNTYKQGSKIDQRAVPINRFLYSTTVQNFTHLSYSFRVTTPIIGAGFWHGPKKVEAFKSYEISLFISTHISDCYRDRDCKRNEQCKNRKCVPRRQGNHIYQHKLGQFGTALGWD